MSEDERALFREVGTWGENSLLGMLQALYPEFPRGSDGLAAVRENSHLSALAAEANMIDDVAELGVLLPRLDEVMQKGWWR
jgi:hypothetical protein